MIAQTSWKKIHRNLRDYGILSTSIKSARYLLSPLFQHQVYRIYCLDLKTWAGRERRALKFTFQFAGPGDVEIIRQIEAMEEWLLGKVQGKLKMKSICLVALDNNRVAGFNLVSFGEIYMPLVRLSRKIADNEAWSEQITVSKNYRRMGLGSEMRYRVFDELKRRNIWKVCGGALRDNTASLGLARQLGFREVEDIHFLKFFGFKKWKYDEVVQ